MNFILLITQCNDPLKWYSNKVGQYVVCLGIEEKEYKSREDAGYINFVSKEDAILKRIVDATSVVLDLKDAEMLYINVHDQIKEESSGHTNMNRLASSNNALTLAILNAKNI